MDSCSYVRKNTFFAAKGGCICTPLTPPGSATAVCSLNLQLTQHTPVKALFSVCYMNENAYSDITINETESILSYICTHGLTLFTLCGKAPCVIGAGTGPAGPAMAGPFSAEVET